MLCLSTKKQMPCLTGRFCGTKSRQVHSWINNLHMSLEEFVGLLLVH